MKKIRLPIAVNKIISRLEHAGFEAYAVGGCVRDSLLKRNPDDWDITTSAKPAEVKKIFRRTIDTGIAHGTVTVLMSGEDTLLTGERGYEVTTYRIDGEYLDGRHPSSVTFTPSLHEDLARRDFTINAMAYNDRTGVIDDFGGMEDLEQKIIRAVGDPEQRFTEDALRMLRALRFSAQLNFTIDPDTYQAIRKLAPNLSHVSKERIQTELTKLLMSDHPDHIALVSASDLAPYIAAHFDEAFDVPSELAAPSPYIRQWMPDGLPGEKYLRWGTFLRGVPADAGRILRELRMDNDTIKKAKIIAALFQEDLPENMYEIRKILSVIGYEAYGAFLDADECLCRDVFGEESAFRVEKIHTVRKHIQAIREAGDCISLKELAVKGQDLIEAGIPKGPAVGEMLHRLLEDVLRVPSHNTREILMAIARP
ncbi:MAG: CCA tRNA nucleotidyltransferase [Oribacterium sp.]|nr:CCA tRNA nucleotidyltransferase [Oribacterium sp.]